MRERRAASISVGILFAINVLNFYDRTVVGIVTEPIRKEFHLTDTQIGLMGSAFIWLYALIGVPLGWLADVISRKKLLAFGVLVWTALTACTYLVRGYTLLVFTRMGVGIGEAVCAPTATSWLGDLVPAAKRGRVLGLFMIGLPLGSALAAFFSGPISDAYGWRVAMLVAAAPAIILIPILLALREPSRGASETCNLMASQQRRSFLKVLQMPTLLWIIASGALLNFNSWAVSSFLPALFSRVYHLSSGDAGINSGIVYLLGGVMGGLLGGWIGDRWACARQNGRMLLAALFALLAAPFSYLGTLAPTMVVAVVLWIAAYALLISYYGLVYASIQDIVSPAERGSTMGIYFVGMYLGGASFGPLVTGKLSDFFARQASGSGVITAASKALGLQHAMLVIPAFSIALGIVLLMGSRTLSRDMQVQELRLAAAAAS